MQDSPTEYKHWDEEMRKALCLFLAQKLPKVDEHVLHTPDRVVRAMDELVSGYGDMAATILRSAVFKSNVDAMVHVAPITVHTTCAHHLQPIIGIVHFAYIPDGQIVGLSKIPRFIHSLSRRLHVQESFCKLIVDTFNMCVHPAGSAVWMKAVHCCMSSRGIEEHHAKTKVMCVTGAFRKSARARAELMAAIDQDADVVG